MPEKSPLNDKQKLFCLEYTVNYDATEAAIKAGYSKKTAKTQGSRLLKNPQVLDYVRKIQKDQAERLCVTSDWVVMQLVEVYKRCMQQEEVLIWDSDTKQKVPSGEYVFDSKGALNALEKIGKHLGMFSSKDDTTENTQNNGGIIMISSKLPKPIPPVEENA